MIAPLVSTDWLANHLDDDDVIVLDASMINIKGMEAITYDSQQYIPNSYRCDLENELRDLTSPLPNTFPSEECFNQLAQRLGIHSHSHLVLYDNQGAYSSPRAWLIFKIMGHSSVSILDGGLPQWLKEQRPVVSTIQSSAPASGTFIGKAQWQRLIAAQEILDKLTENTTIILDSRSPGRFRGDKAEPRKGMRSGHIPGAINLPFQRVWKNGKFKSPAELSELFKQTLNTDNQTEITPTTPLIFSCGSGLTACIILFAAYLAGYQQMRLYDGSWSEWGSNADYPVDSH